MHGINDDCMQQEALHKWNLNLYVLLCMCVLV